MGRCTDSARLCINNELEESARTNLFNNVKGGRTMSRDRKIKVAAIQMKSELGKTDINLSRAITFIEEAAQNGADIVCLPELFYTGYHLSASELQQVAEPVNGPMVSTLQKVAKANSVYVIGGYAESVEILGRMYNSAIFINDKGEVLGNMRKVYAWGEERIKFREGEEFPVYDTPLGKIGLMICYDAEFPEPMRIAALKGAEIVFVPSVWSFNAQKRWHVDLEAGALYNLFFTVGVNTIDDGACGSSKMVSPYSETIAQASTDKEEIIYADIDLGEVVKARSVIPYLNDFKEKTFNMNAVELY